MAAQNPNNIFDNIASEIIQKFDKLIAQLFQRRDELLFEIKRRKEAFEEGLKARNETLAELEHIRVMVQQTSLKENSVMDMIKTGLAPIEKQIRELKATIVKPPSLSFQLPFLELSKKLRNAGSISDGDNLTICSEPLHTIKFDQNFLPSSLHIDSEDSQLYVCENGASKRFLIFNTKNWELLKNYSDDKIEPLSITTDTDHIYITYLQQKSSGCAAYRVGKMDKTSYKMIRSVDGIGNSIYGDAKFDRPYHLTLTPSKELLVADYYYNRVCIFDINLVSVLSFGDRILKEPRSIQCTNNLIYVLNSESFSIHAFNLSGKLVNSFFQGKAKILARPKSFCIDEAGNFIVSDYVTGSISIFSPEQKLIHQIGDVAGCSGVELFQGKIIVACSSLGCIKIF